MAQLTTSQLIKILLGIFVVVVVIGGVFLLFKDTIIDFFDNLTGGEEETSADSEELEQQEEGIEEAPERWCEDCRGNIIFSPCSEKKCESISQELNYLGLGCEYIAPTKKFFAQGQCNQINIQ